MEIQPGSIVKSLAGRDHDRLFVVISIEPNFANLADGRIRKAEKPKRKKLKHIAYVCRAEDRVAQRIARGDKVTNSEIRRMLSELSESAGLISEEV